MNGTITESKSPAVGSQSDEVTKFGVESLTDNPANLVERGAEKCSPLIQSMGKSDDGEAEVLISSKHCEPAGAKSYANSNLQPISLDSSSSASKKVCIYCISGYLEESPTRLRMIEFRCIC